MRIGLAGTFMSGLLIGNLVCLRWTEQGQQVGMGVRIGVEGVW